MGDHTEDAVIVLPMIFVMMVRNNNQKQDG